MLRGFFSAKIIAVFLIILAMVLFLLILYNRSGKKMHKIKNDWIAVTDQKGHQILLLDSKEDNWDSEYAVKWSWQPTSKNGFDKGQIIGWKSPSDVRFRESDFFGGTVMLACDSHGLGTLVSYPSGKRLWSINVGDPTETENNLHAIELLPNGNVVMAATSGGYIRVYTASQGADAISYAEFQLKDAHGALWDPEKELLWVLGYDYLTALRVEGEDDSPRLVEETSYRTKLPSLYGHDLQPVYGNTNRLWVTTGMGVYQFIKSEKSWDSQYPGAFGASFKNINRSNVKSVGNHAIDHSVIEVKPTGVLHAWCTNQVEFFYPDAEPNYKVKIRTDMAIYKARYVNCDYQ